MQRRQLIKSMLLFAATGIISALAKPIKPFFVKRIGVKKISGKLLANGKPLVNVVVTDGFTLVTTDHNGAYQLEADVKAQFITVSTPAGYDFIAENGIVRQYKEIEPVASNNIVDFEFKPLDVNDQQHQFIIWADPQVKTKADVKKLMKESIPDLRKTVKFMPNKLVHAICVGDMVWDKHELFPDYNLAVAESGIPFFQVKGNHDMDYLLGGNETSDITFKKQFGPTHYSFNRGSAHYVVLDDVFYLGIERTYEARITQNQLDWLEKDLSYVPKNHLLIVCLHIPVHNANKFNKDLYNILKPFSNCHIMSGHTHYNKNVITDGIFEHNHGTVCGAWWTGPICEDGTPDGYGVYKVNGTELQWYYQSTGQLANYQISLFLQKDETGNDQLVANVFNWDPDWKVEWFKDDVYMGVLNNSIGFDPLAVATLKGPDLPVARSFAEPKKTDHLFVQNITGVYKTIKIQATDRFGNIYQTVST